ncbi:MAG: hypothetical protein ABI970_10745, partial [Chloroflexota bacterium]
MAAAAVESHQRNDAVDVVAVKNQRFLSHLQHLVVVKVRKIPLTPALHQLPSQAHSLIARK